MPWPQEACHLEAFRAERLVGQEEHHLVHRRPCLPSAPQYRLDQGEEEPCQRQEALGAYREAACQERRPSSGAVALGPCLVIEEARQYRHRLAAPE